MEHVIQPVVIVGALDGVHIPGILHHADNIMPPVGIGTDGTGVHVRVIAAYRAKMHLLFPVENGYRQFPHLLLRHGQNMIRQPLGGFSAHAGQLG